MKIPYYTLSPIHQEIKAELLDSFNQVIDKGNFINGIYCQQFEEDFASYSGGKYAIGCGNGLDAITIALMANGVGEGDEVIVPTLTFIATAIAVERTGAKPVFVDVSKNTSLIDCKEIEKAITDRTKAIVPVLLYGLCVDIDSIKKIASNHNLIVVLDAAQAHGVTFKDEKIGSMADAACFSFYPGKNLGALGDGGAIVTDSDNYVQMKALTNYGSREKYVHETIGFNSRLDEIQAAFLRIKLKGLDKITEAKKRQAGRYISEINNPNIMLPDTEGRDSVWHIFAIHSEIRDELQKKLSNEGIETLIHYPIPIHLQKAFSTYNLVEGSFPNAEWLCRTELSLPIYYGLSDDEQSFIIDTINKM